MHYIIDPEELPHCVSSAFKKSFNKWENWGLEKLRDFIQGHTDTEDNARIPTNLGYLM